MPPHRISADRILPIARHVAFGLVFVVVFAGVFGAVAMVAWNAVMPAVFGLPALTFLQAVAGLVLARIVAGRFTHGGRGGRPRFRRFHCAPARDSAALYSSWWDSEGEAAFQAYVDRHLGEQPQG